MADYLKGGWCERHLIERILIKKLNVGFCEGCPWIDRCGLDDINYPCHGRWNDVDYIDYGNNAINMDMDEE